MTEVPDALRRDVMVQATRERVWAAITEPSMLLRRFPTEAAEVDLRPGGAMRFVWEGNEGTAAGWASELAELRTYLESGSGAA
jgi:uncharacterized protein YndB with AHSA1/START domain